MLLEAWQDDGFLNVREPLRLYPGRRTHLTIGCFGFGVDCDEVDCLLILCVNRNLGAMVCSFLFQV